MDRSELPGSGPVDQGNLLAPAGPLADSHPRLSQVIRNMVYDNGGVNRSRPEEEFWQKAIPFIHGQPPENLAAIESFLQTLTDADCESLADGEYEHNQEILTRAPAGANLDNLLNTLFDEAV